MSSHTCSRCPRSKHPLKGIGAKIALAWTGICAFAVVHASDIARHGDFGAGLPGEVERRSLRSERRRSGGWRATAAGARRSRGRDTKLLREGFGHERDEEVGKNPRPCDPWVLGGGSAQPDQALQTLEVERDAQAHAIEL